MMVATGKLKSSASFLTVTEGGMLILGTGGVVSVVMLFKNSGRIEDLHFYYGRLLAMDGLGDS